jgi:hypothetical protein
MKKVIVIALLLATCTNRTAINVAPGETKVNGRVSLLGIDVIGGEENKFALKSDEEFSIENAIYKSAEELLKENNEKAKMEYWDSIKLCKMNSIIPKQGYFQFKYSSLTPGYHIAIAIDSSGKIIDNKEYNGVAGFVSHRNELRPYQGVIIHYINQESKECFTVHVINQVESIRGNYKICP